MRGLSIFTWLFVVLTVILAQAQDEVGEQGACEDRTRELEAALEQLAAKEAELTTAREAAAIARKAADDASADDVEDKDRIKVLTKEIEDSHATMTSKDKEALESAQQAVLATEKSKQAESRVHELTEELEVLRAQQKEAAAAKVAEAASTLSSSSATKSSSSSSSSKKKVHVRDLLDDLVGLAGQAVDVGLAYGKVVWDKPSMKKVRTAVQPVLDTVGPLLKSGWEHAEPVLASAIDKAKEEATKAKDAAIPVLKDSWKDMVVAYQDAYDYCEVRVRSMVRGTVLDGQAEKMVKYFFMFLASIVLVLMSMPAYYLVRFLVTSAVNLVLWVVKLPFRMVWGVVTWPVYKVIGKPKPSRGGGRGGGGGGSSGGGGGGAPPSVKKVKKGGGAMETGKKTR